MKVSICSDSKAVRLEKQRGFTLVNIAAAIVGSTFMVGAAVQGNVLLQNYQQDRLYEDLRTLEDQVWSHFNQQGRWPGDCNGDGSIGYQPPAQASVKEGKVSATACQTNHSEGFAAVVGDLQMIQADTSMLQSHSLGGTVQVGQAPIGESHSNAIFVYDVPAELAQWLDQRVDGLADADAGRLQLWQAQAGDWNKLKADQPVSVVYFFERTLPSS